MAPKQISIHANPISQHSVPKRKTHALGSSVHDVFPTLWLLINSLFVMTKSGVSGFVLLCLYASFCLVPYFCCWAVKPWHADSNHVWQCLICCAVLCLPAITSSTCSGAIRFGQVNRSKVRESAQQHLKRHCSVVCHVTLNAMF